MKAIPFLLTSAIMLPIAGRAQETLSVEGPRPLWLAISILERKYGWRVYYEEAPYTDPKDLVDKTHPSYRGTWRAIDPRDGRLEFRYAVSPLTGKPDSALNLLQVLVDDHAKRGNAGKFQVKMLQGQPLVAPPQASVLDVPISLAQRERTFDEVLEEVGQAVSRSSGIQVRPMRSIIHPRKQSLARINFSANREVARNVLLRLFETQKDKLYWWHLVYGPKWGYFLHVYGQLAPVVVTDRPQPTPPPVVAPGSSNPRGNPRGRF